MINQSIQSIVIPIRDTTAPMLLVDEPVSRISTAVSQISDYLGFGGLLAHWSSDSVCPTCSHQGFYKLSEHTNRLVENCRLLPPD